MCVSIASNPMTFRNDYQVNQTELSSGIVIYLKKNKKNGLKTIVEQTVLV